MKIAICDDSVEYINTIETYLKKIDDKNVTYDIYMSGEDLLDAYKKGDTDYDALFLDMEMADLDGIETANSIRKIDDKLIIVFVTSHTKYMQKSFECTPFRFLVKPLEFMDFKKTYDEIIIKLKDKPEAFVFSENRKRTRIFCSDIVFFESRAHSILIYSKNGRVYKTRKTMSELAEILKNSTFVRVHRAFMVNLGHIHQIDESDILMHHHNTPIPLSKLYKRDVVDEFLNYKERKYLL